MTVANQQYANAENFNKAFASKMADSTMAGVLSLDNEASGSRIANLQKAVNQLLSAIGTLEGSEDMLIFGANFLLDGDSFKESLKKIDAKLKDAVDNISSLSSPAFEESAQEVTGTTISIPASAGMATILVSATEAKTLDAAPFGTKTWRDGLTVDLVGQGANAITLPYSDTDEGCLLNGDMTLIAGASITLRYSATLKRFLEIGRS